jgi:hypothetical protein
VQLQGVEMISSRFDPYALSRYIKPAAISAAGSCPTTRPLAALRAALRRHALGGAAAIAAATLLAAGTAPALAHSPSQHSAAVQSQPHVYLLRGLMNIFSLGMDELAAEIQRAGIPATVDSYADGDALVAKLTAQYRAGDHGPIILIGHSLGADAVMQMAQMLNRNNVPVALLVPFDGTQSFRAPKNVARVLNLTQREYAYMRPGSGFHGMLKNVDVSGDPNIGHITIDKSPRLHALVLSYVRGVVGAPSRRPASSLSAAKHAPPAAKEPAPQPTAPQSSTPQPAKPAYRGRLEGKAASAGAI